MDKPTSLNIRLLVIYRQGRQGEKVKHRSRLVYIPEALPCFEVFGNLPTELMCEVGLACNMPAAMDYEVLVEKFKNICDTEFKANNPKSGRKERCW